MSGLIPRVSGLGGEPPSLRAPCATGTPHPLFSLDEKKGEKNHMGRHLDTPNEIILQASLRMHFEGGQGRCIFLADSVAERSA